MRSKEDERLGLFESADKLKPGASRPGTTILDQGKVHITRRPTGHQAGNILSGTCRRPIRDAALLLLRLFREGVDQGIVITPFARRQDAHLQMGKRGRPASAEGQETEKPQDTPQHGQLQGNRTCRGTRRPPEPPLEPFCQPGCHGVVLLQGRSGQRRPARDSRLFSPQ
jgi:hypothetical protein